MSSKIIISLAVVFGLTLFVAAYDPKSAVGPCILGRCPPGHVCSNDECYPKMKDYVDVDAKGTNAIGPCVNGFCPSGYQCLGNKCYKGQNKRSIRQAIGPCIGGLCPTGYTCNQSEQKCY
uniref:CC domain-containing protein n=1 Tax=Panagrolaimus sp. JU765 TaxID=591449 RepID=A0AC34PWL5_9BILA